MNENEGGSSGTGPDRRNPDHGKRGRGRPPKGNDRRDQMKPIRWTWEQWREVEAAAQECALSASEFIRESVLSRARTIFEEKRKRGMIEREEKQQD